jgi:hypothetical protein
MNSEVPVPDAKFQFFFQRFAQGGYPLFAVLIKPNTYELSRLAERELQTESEIMGF